MRRCALSAKATLAAAALLSCACHEAGGSRAHIAVGTFWQGQASLALQRELIRISRDLGPVSIEVRTFGMAALNDYFSHPQPLAGRESLDLAIVPHHWLGQLAQREVIGELPSERAQFLRQRLVGQALLAASEGERVFGYPVSAEVLALVYDPTIFPYPPRTIDEILSTRFQAGVLPFALDISNPQALAPLVGSLQGAADRRGRLPPVAPLRSSRKPSTVSGPRGAALKAGAPSGAAISSRCRFSSTRLEGSRASWPGHGFSRRWKRATGPLR